MNVVFGRDALTAASLTGLQDDTGGGVEVGAPELDPQSEEVGEGALVAFSAGLVGLSATLPKMPGDSSESVLVGLTLTAERDGLEATHDPDEAKPDLVERAVHLLNEDFPPRGGVLAVGVDGWIFASPACDGAGGLVGALVAIVSPPPVDAEDLADPSSGAAAGSESMAAALDVAADGYARLLIDLLGEQALPPAGAQRTDRGS